MNSLELQMAFGKRLRALRRERDWTQEHLAECLELSTEYVSRLERGVVGSSFETLARLAEVFGIEVQQLFVFPSPSVENQNAVQQSDDVTPDL